MVLLNVVGQMGPLVGVRLFPEDDAPWFVRGLGVSAACMAGVAGLAAGLRCWLRRLNRREAQRESERWGREGVELEELGAGEEEVGEDRAGAGEGLIRRRKKGREREKKFEYIL